MGEIAKDVEVRVTGPSSTEHGTVGVVESVRQGWTGKEAVVKVPGFWSRKFTVPVTDLSRA